MDNKTVQDFISFRILLISEEINFTLMLEFHRAYYTSIISKGIQEIATYISVAEFYKPLAVSSTYP